MSLFETVNHDIAQAMKAHDKVRLDTLRNIKKLFLEAQTAPGAGNELSDAQAQQIMAKMVKQGKDAAAIFTQQGRADLAEEELKQVAVIEGYLPEPLTPEQLEQEIRAIMAETGAAGPKDMGKVMGVATKKLMGRADGRAISAVVKQLVALVPERPVCRPFMHKISAAFCVIVTMNAAEFFSLSLMAAVGIRLPCRFFINTSRLWLEAVCGNRAVRMFGRNMSAGLEKNTCRVSKTRSELVPARSYLVPLVSAAAVRSFFCKFAN